MRLIDADKLAKKIQANDTYTGEEIIRALSHEEFSPTVDAELVWHAHWIEGATFWYQQGLEITRYRCSLCGMITSSSIYDGKLSRCPWCGAKMDEGVSE